MDIRNKRLLVNVQSQIVNAICSIDEMDESDITPDIKDARRRLQEALRDVQRELGIK